MYLWNIHSPKLQPNPLPPNLRRILRKRLRQIMLECLDTRSMQYLLRRKLAQRDIARVNLVRGGEGLVGEVERPGCGSGRGVEDAVDPLWGEAGGEDGGVGEEGFDEVVLRS